MRNYLSVVKGDDALALNRMNTSDEIVGGIIFLRILKKIAVIFQNECCKLLNLQPALCNILPSGFNVNRC